MKRISILLITVALITGMVGCDGGNGPDPYADYIKIYSWTDLDNIRNNLVAKYVLMNNLDSTTAGYEELASPTANGGKGWDPIGTFTGTFDGQGYEIRDLFINRPGEDCVGLFGYVAAGGVIENIGVVNTNVTSRGNVGSLVGWNVGTVSNSYSTGSVTGDWSVGGLMGVNAGGTVSNSYYNYDEVLINGENIITTGALFNEDFQQWLANNKFLDIDERLSQENGYYMINNVSDFKQLLAFGQDDSLKFRLKDDLDLATTPNFYIPCLAGEFDGNGHKISNLSFNFDFVTNVGLFGYLVPGGKVTQLGVENVSITGSGAVGGLAGGNGGTVSNSYSTGNVTGIDCVGGLVGIGSGNVSNSYSSGNVTGLGNVGGLVGQNAGNVSNSYSTGSVSGDSDIGGLVGDNYGTVSNSFWDTETSGQATSAGGTGKTTAEMQDITTFSGAAWNITAVANPGIRNPSYIWNIVDDVTYPFLSWQPIL
jgi:hypothetical protein